MGRCRGSRRGDRLGDVKERQVASRILTRFDGADLESINFYHSHSPPLYPCALLRTKYDLSNLDAYHESHLSTITFIWLRTLPNRRSRRETADRYL